MNANLKRSLTGIVILGAMLAGVGNPNTAAARSPKYVEEIMSGAKVKTEDAVAKSTVMLVGKGSQGEYLCTASILAPDMLVTAAHCVQTNPENIRVVFALSANKNKSPNPSQVMPIDGYLANPKYRGENFQGVDMGDIAVIRLAEKIPAGYAPAKLLPASAELESGESTVLAGFGVTSAATEKGAGTLRRVTAVIHGPVSSTEVAIDETNHHASCSGDSGGPAFIARGEELLLWGVTSRGDAACDHVGIYTRISSYINWIHGAEKQLRSERR